MRKLVPLVIVASLIALPDANAKPATIDIQAGAVHPANRSAPYEYTRFYPDTIKVHRGQVVRWKTFGFHTITFSKAGHPGFFRPDELPGTYARPEKWFLGSNCGRGGLPPCAWKPSTSFLSSSVPVLGSNSFEVKVDLPSGKYRYFCTVHPAMSGTVEVVGSITRVATQRQIDIERAAQIRKDSDAADAIFRAGQKPISRIDAAGRRVWQVLLGDSTPDEHVSILAYLPTNLEVAAGDKVSYVFRDRHVNEPHSVTFPTELVGSRAPAPHGLGGQGFQISCDLDHPSTGMKGLPGPWAIRAPCPANLEIVYAPWMIEAHPAPGNQVATRATYHDSGMLQPPSAPRDARTLPDTGRMFPRSFGAEFPVPGSFVFECTVHADLMTGSVTVS